LKKSSLFIIQSVDKDFKSLVALFPRNCWQLGLAALLSIYTYPDFKTNCNPWKCNPQEGGLLRTLLADSLILGCLITCYRWSF